MLDRYLALIEERRLSGLYREILPSTKKEIDFSTNDYLGFSQNHKIKQAIAESLDLGVGATGARLLSGNSKIFSELEEQIAQDKLSESALVMGSGFQTNFSVLSSLLDASVLGDKPIVFFDRLNHSSLYQAIFLTKAELVRYQHLDLDHLQYLTRSYNTDKRPKFIVSETLFGMDGDSVDLQRLINTARDSQALLYLDEAHATGILGNGGYGMSTDFDFSGVEHVLMGTFSKAIGLFGGYIATSTLLKNYIVNKAPGFIYSTAIPPCMCAGILTAWHLLKSTAQVRRNLLRAASDLRFALSRLGCNIGNSNSHIIPIICDRDCSASLLKSKLSELGYMVSAIRPPTVPSERIRIALCNFHTENQVAGLLLAIKESIEKQTQ